MVITGISPRGRESGFRGRGDFACGIRNPGKILLLETVILGFGIRNIA